MALSQEQLVATLKVYKKKLARLNKSIIALIEKGDDASVPVIDMKVKNSINTIGEIQDELNLVDYESVQVQFDEVIEMSWNVMLLRLSQESSNVTPPNT